MATPLRFSYNNVMEDAVGGDGLPASALDPKAAAAAVAAFRGRVDSGEIGFPNLPADRKTADAIMEFADELRPGIDDVLLVGIGGSALGAYALDVALRGPHPLQSWANATKGTANGKAKSGVRPRLVVLDNVDPGLVAAALEQLNPKRTAVCVIAKSGSTAETLATFLIVREWMMAALGKRARGQIIAVTDSEKGDLLAIAKAEQYPLFFVPGNVGGRFSVLTPVGLVPAALIGIDIGKLLKGAREATAACWSSDSKENQALVAAQVHCALNERGKRTEVVFAYSSYLWGAAFWYRQQKDQHDDEDKDRSPARADQPDQEYLHHAQQHRADHRSLDAAQPADHRGDEALHDELSQLRIERVVDSQKHSGHAAQHAGSKKRRRHHRVRIHAHQLGRGRIERTAADRQPDLRSKQHIQQNRQRRRRKSQRQQVGNGHPQRAVVQHRRRQERRI